MSRPITLLATLLLGLSFLGLSFLGLSFLGLSFAKAQQPAPDAKDPSGEFRIDEVASLSDLPAAQLKPKSIAFTDRPAVPDAATGFMRFEDWAKARPIEQQLLSLYPGYAEPNTDLVIDGAKRHYKEKLHMYVASARFALPRPASSIDLARLITLPFVEQIDRAIKSRMIAGNDVTATADPKVVYNQNPKRHWCEARPIAICLRSHYQLEGRFPSAIALANKLRDSKPIPDYLEFESELTLRSPEEVQQAGLSKLTGLDTPSSGAIEQSIFYINQAMQFGKLVAVFQQFPNDQNRSVVTVFMALAPQSKVLDRQKQFAHVPVLRNMVPAQVLLGKSSFNIGNSLSAGLPVYARNSIKSIAAILDRGE